MNEMTSLKVLVVDDDPDTAAGLAELLITRGHQARIAHDGRGALRQVRNEDFQLVLLDIGLPDMDGYELARRLALLGQRSLSVVALTGYGGEEHLRRSGSAGLDGHVVKPCGSEQLTRILDDAMARASRARLSAA